MKKIINNKQYNTETAKKCGEYEPNLYRSDFNWFCETLYQKKNGEFFLHGDGNANSRYRRSCGQNEWCGDEKIIPMTYQEAQEWAEKHLDGDEYEEIFGDVSEDGGKTTICISLTESDAQKIRQAAAKAGKTVSAYIAETCTK